jgi:IS30 family transposase
MRRSLRSIALHLGRSASTISREVHRNGGPDRYRAARSDQAAWDRARNALLDNRLENPGQLAPVFQPGGFDFWLNRFSNKCVC